MLETENQRQPAALRAALGLTPSIRAASGNEMVIGVSEGSFGAFEGMDG